LGELAHDRGDTGAARKHYMKARSLFHHVGEVRGEAGCLRGLAVLALERGDDAEANAYNAQAALFERTGDADGQG
jgi:hypothetical protein